MSKIRSMLAALVAVAAGISMPVNVALADTAAYKQLSSEWWQWALSIPADENPLADTTGANCMVGQRGSNWFLAGTFGDTTVIRTCSIPEDATLFFPGDKLRRLRYAQRVRTGFHAASLSVLPGPRGGLHRWSDQPVG